MYFALYPTKDTTITDADIRNNSRTGSNQGASEILDLFVLTSSISNTGISRILMHFDLETLSSSIASGQIATSSVQYRLRMKNAPHYETLPSSFTVIIHPLSRSWDEGRGLSNYDEGLKDLGYANWKNATSTVLWSLTGSDFIVSPSASQHFDLGVEDLDVDISNIVYSWLTGGLVNNGLLLKFIDSQETGSIDFYVKKFFSRHAHVPERRPRLEALWQDIVQDDRDNIHYGITGSLFYYRIINGQLTPLQQVFVNILNSSSTVVQTLTASSTKVGIYHASGVLVSPTSSTQVFRDVWFSGTSQYFTGNFIPNYSTGSQFFNYNQLDVLLPNLKTEYGNDEKTIVNVFVKEKDYRPAIKKSGSVEIKTISVPQAYYSIINAETDETIVEFSTGSSGPSYSKLSYDKNGNYFELWTGGLTKKAVYKIKILINYNNQKHIFDRGWIFKVE